MWWVQLILLLVILLWLGRTVPPASDAAAKDLLSRLADRVDRLLPHLPDEDWARRVRERWSRERLREGGNQGVSAYTLNKGEAVVLCLRNPSGQLHEETVLWFVLLHELSHLAGVGTGHDQEYQENFSRLFMVARQAGLYPLQNQTHVPYCRTTIKHLP